MTRIALLLLLLLLPQAVLAAGGEQLSFADSLAAEGDHYRAITEYKRFLHQHPQDGLAPKARLAIARSLLAGQRWDQADRALELVMELHPATQEATAAGRAYADSAFERGDYGLARSRYRRLLEQGNDAEQRQRARYRIGWTFLEEGQLSEAKGAFGKLEPDLAAELLPALDRYQELPQKSPRLAGALSALLPGAGQLYTGRVKQAGLALALNATFLYGALEAFNNDNHAVGGILLFFEAGWYGGNIYNAVNNAHKYNRRQQARAKAKLHQRFGLQLGWQNDRPLLLARLRF